ncbi:MAG: hypothetical protein ACSLE1_12230 [Sphingobium sp.]
MRLSSIATIVLAIILSGDRKAVGQATVEGKLFNLKGEPIVNESVTITVSRLSSVVQGVDSYDIDLQIDNVIDPASPKKGLASVVSSDGKFKIQIPVNPANPTTQIIRIQFKRSGFVTTRELKGIFVENTKTHLIDVTVPEIPDELCPPPQFVPVYEPAPFCQHRLLRRGLFRR